MEQAWRNPSPNELRYDDSFYDDNVYDGNAPAFASGRHGPALDTTWIRIASEIAPTTSPAPAGHPIVPAGWVLQMGAEGEQDTMLLDNRGATPAYRANITQVVVPYYSGGWPPDPLIGTPGHTPPTL